MKIILSCSFSFLLSIISLAQSNTKKEISSTVLPSGYTAIVESEKYIWKGTHHGLIRITKKNGYFVIFNSGNSILPSDSVTSICCRQDGNVWIGTTKGIMRYDLYAYLLVTTENSGIPDNNITAIVEDGNGALWIGTKSGGVARLCGFRYSVYNHCNSSLTDDHIVGLAIDASGTIVVKTRDQAGVNPTNLVSRK